MLSATCGIACNILSEKGTKCSAKVSPSFTPATSFRQSFSSPLEGSGIQAVLEDQFLEGWSLRCPERNEGARRQAFQAAEGLTPKHHRASS